MSAYRTDLGNGVRRHSPHESGEGLIGQALHDRCLELARDLGLARAGVASVENFEAEIERLAAFLREGRHGEMLYLARDDEAGRPLRADVRNVFPEVRSAICVALPYALSEPPQQVPSLEEPLRGTIAGYAQCPDYHVVLKDLLLSLADQLCVAAAQSITSRVCVDSAPLLERDLALRAGFAFLGKNTLAIAPGAGSCFLLGELLVDLEVPRSQSYVTHGCGSCTACLTSCPTDAFVGPFRLDARRCISYLTIEKSGTIPRSLRSSLSDHVFGCDDCQSVCPYNQSRKLPSAPDVFASLPRLSAPDLIGLLQLRSGEYKRLVAGTALRRVTRDQLARNAAVALGNRGDVRAIEPLFLAARDHVSSLVRAHAAWGLGTLGWDHGHEQAKARARALASETKDEDVAEELEFWLRG